MNPARGAIQWRIPIGFLLVPVGLMMLLLPILKESPVRLAHISNPSHLADWMTGEGWRPSTKKTKLSPTSLGSADSRKTT